MLVKGVPLVKCDFYGEVGYASNWFSPEDTTLMDAWLELRKAISMAEQNHLMIIIFTEFSQP